MLNIVNEMGDTQNQRLKEAFEYLKTTKRIRNQQDFTERIESDRSTVSQILNDKIKIPNNLFGKVTKAFPEISKEWLEFGQGEMICPNINQENINGTNVVGENTVNNLSSELIDIIKKKDEQIDRLITLLENVSKK